MTSTFRSARREWPFIGPPVWLMGLVAASSLVVAFALPFIAVEPTAYAIGVPLNFGSALLNYSNARRKHLAKKRLLAAERPQG